VLFNAPQGRLYALNEAAALAWLCVKDRLSTSETTRAIASAFRVDTSVAAEWLRASMETFEAAGLLPAQQPKDAIDGAPQKRAASQSSGAAERPASGEDRLTTREYRIFEQLARIAAPHCLQPAIESLLGGLRADSRVLDADGPGFDLKIAPEGSDWKIMIGDEVVAHCETEAVVSEIERLLVQAVVPSKPHLLTLHAAAVQSGSGPLLLVGHSGAGKTTLSVALTRGGWRFGSDEIVLLCRDLSLRPLPLPACIKEDNFSLVETWFPILRGTREHKRYGHRVKYLPLKSHSLRGGSGFVIFLSHQAERGNELRPLDSFSGLQRLLEHCLFVPPGFDHSDVPRLLEWHSGQRYFEFFFNDCGKAVTLLSKMVDEGTKFDSRSLNLL